jgi:hypothetical protein
MNSQATQDDSVMNSSSVKPTSSGEEVDLMCSETMLWWFEEYPPTLISSQGF